MNDVICVYTVITLVVNFIWWIVAIGMSGMVGVCFCNPKWIYNHTKTNWFGTICLAILTNVAFGPSALCYWFYKLCTVGRR
jgi:hypothetical protein